MLYFVSTWDTPPIEGIAEMVSAGAGTRLLEATGRRRGMSCFGRLPGPVVVGASVATNGAD